MSNTQKIVPNKTPFPSLVYDDPFGRLNLLTGAGGANVPVSDRGQVDATLVDPLAGIEQPGIGEITPQGPLSDLMKLRSLFPNVPIMPLMSQFATVFLPTANLADEMIFPDGTTVCQFFSPQDFYMSPHGNAEVPTVTNSPAQKTGTQSSVRSIYKPVGTWFYVGNVKSVSVVAPNANTIVQALCYITNVWPVRC